MKLDENFTCKGGNKKKAKWRKREQKKAVKREKKRLQIEKKGAANSVMKVARKGKKEEIKQ